jgi:hypothetical protein
MKVHITGEPAKTAKPKFRQLEIFPLEVRKPVTDFPYQIADYNPRRAPFAVTTLGREYLFSYSTHILSMSNSYSFSIKPATGLHSKGRFSLLTIKTVQP